MSATYEAESKTADDTVQPNSDNITYETLPIDNNGSDNDDNTDINTLIHKLQNFQSTTQPTTLQPNIQYIYNILYNTGCIQTANNLLHEYNELNTTQQHTLETQLSTVQQPTPPTQYNDTDTIQQLQAKLQQSQSLLDQTLKHYINLKKQRNYYRINYRRVIQEKNILLNDLKYLKTKLSTVQEQTVDYTYNVEKLTRQITAVKVERDKYKTRCEKYESTADSTIVTQPTTATKRVPVAVKSNSSTMKKSAAINKTIPPLTTNINDSVLPPAHYSAPQLTPARDLTQYNSTATLTPHTACITSVSIHPNKPLFVTSSDDKSWSLHSMESNETLLSCQNAHTDWLSCSTFHATGQLFATGGGDCTVKIWNLLHEQYNQAALTIQEHSQPIWDIKFHADGNYILSCSNDHTIKLYDLNSQRNRYTFRGHVDTVNAISWQNDSSVFVSGSGDKTVSVWDIRAYSKQANCLINTIYNNAAVTDVCNSVCGQYIVYSDADGYVKCVDTRNRYSELWVHRCSERTPINSITYDHSNTYIIYTSNNTVYILHAQNGTVVHQYDTHTDTVQCVAIDTQNQYIVSGGNDCTVKIWS